MSQESAPQSVEWREENALTAPEDRNPDKSYMKKLSQGHPPLEEEEVKEAMVALNNTQFIEKFPSVERSYADPMMPMQVYGLVSFCPAKGATPNAQGIYGFAKLRGNFAQQIESNQRAELLIRTADSYHQIYHAYVGRPFPLTRSSNYSAETSEIDIRKATTESVSAEIKAKKQEEKQTVKDIKEREQNLIVESKQEEEDPEEVYTTNQVKLAQLKWTYTETLKKMETMKASIIKTRELIEQADEEHPEWKKEYMARYMAAREASGLKMSNDDNNFISYMVNDVDVGF
jgi:hypothetical protein